MKKSSRIFCFKKCVSDTCKSLNINNLKWFEYKFYIAITSYMVLIYGTQFWFAESLEEIWVVIQKASRSFRQLGRNSSHICTARLEACRPMVWRKKRQPTPLFLPRESSGQKSLVGLCP